MLIAGYVIVALLAYLLGSVPTGFLVGKTRGIDIRELGSGNIGATNAFRHLGKPAGVLVLLADALKGWIAVVVVGGSAPGWFWPDAGPVAVEWYRIVAGFFAVVGHNYTCWLRFRGGKGIATSAGVLLGLVPGALFIILGIWVIVSALTRYVSLGSICASAALPFACWVTGRSLTLILITGAMTVMAIYKHKSNIVRLMNGTEHRLGSGTASLAADEQKS